jgi:hypothetical protein
MKHPDIDIDFADREQVLKYIKGVPARLNTGAKHNTGIYFNNIPVASDGVATLEHEHAEQLGYFKLDLLNVGVYENVKNELHLVELMQDPDWSKLKDQSFFGKLIHIGNHYNLAQQMPEPIDSIPRMAMFLAIIRPGKRHLVGKTWREVSETVWQRPQDNQYFFKKSHAVAYAHLVVVDMNLQSI